MLTSYCGGRSGRLKRLQPKFRKGRHCRVEQGCDPSDPRRISLRSSNYSPACVLPQPQNRWRCRQDAVSRQKAGGGLVITVQEFSTMRPAPGRPHRRAIAWA